MYVVSMSREFLCGTWKISKCILNEKVERLGLEGIKFRLDDTGDIMWYNDLSHLSAATGPADVEDISESADVLFNCETYEVLPDTTMHSPKLLFVAFAGYSIEFKVDNLRPGNQLSLHCDGWYTLQCSRVAAADEPFAQGHDAPFTLVNAYENADSMFTDCTINSSDGQQFPVHFCILRLSGFDSSNCCAVQSSTADNCSVAREDGNDAGRRNEIRIAVIPPPIAYTSPMAATAATMTIGNVERLSNSTKAFLLSPKLLISPSLEMFHFPSKLASNLSNSFNCLSASNIAVHNQPKSAEFLYTGQSLLRATNISTSDSNLKTNTATSRPNIFTFADVTGRQSRACPPLSPYRSKSPLWSAQSVESSPPPLSPLTPAQVLQTLPAAELSVVLYWLYAECLPRGLNEEQLERLVSFAESVSRLAKMAEISQVYLQMVRLEKVVVRVVTEIHNCVNRIIDLLHPANVPRDPVGLWASCQCAGREFALACAKLLQFSNIFVRDCPRITRQQRHEIIKYVRSRLPIFLAQIHQMLHHILHVLSALSTAERTALVEFLTPKVSTTLQLIHDIVAQLKQSLHSAYDNLHSDCQNKQRSGGTDGMAPNETDFGRVNSSNRLPFTTQTEFHENRHSARSLRFVLYIYELKRMRDVYGRISAALEIVDEKRISFEQMTAANRTETIRQNLEQLMEVVPVFLERIEYCSSLLETLNGWKEFKFFFKLATNQINGVISKLLDHQSALNDTMNRLCVLVARPAFNAVLLDLGLLHAPTIGTATTPEDINLNINTNLNLAQQCSEPPRKSASSLAKNSLRLLHSGQYSDMEFEIIVMPTTMSVPAGYNADDDVADRSQTNTIPAATQVHVFRAHRVIVATQCEWFAKALSSGMQESIHRRITIHDTSPVIFRRLLLHLYGAPVDKTVGAEQLCELMLLADRFSVDSLKDICESLLRALIDDSSVLCLLALADRLCATALKANCFAFISQNAEVVRAEVFADLPRPLQAEVHELLLWCGRIPEPWRERKPSKKRSHKSSPRSTT